MFETIVVGVDEREGGRDALALAGLLQRSFGSELIAVHAYPYSFFVDTAADPADEAAVRDESRALLGRELEQADLKARTLVVGDDSPGRALHEAAEDCEADLIVVGSDRHGPVGRVLPGDVTASTLHAAPCPVAVAPRGFAEAPRSLRSIGVGFDGSPEAQMALDAAGEIARAMDADVHVTFVVTPVAPVGAWTAHVVAAVPELQRLARERAEADVAAAVARIGERATGHAPDGLAHVELAALSQRVDLMVVGSRGYGPVRRLLLGSASSKLVREASCPVLVLIRSGDDRRDVTPAAGLADADG